MHTLKKNQRGFSTIETVLVLVVLIAVAGVGYYVYKAKNSTTKTYNSAASTASTSTTAAWKTYNDAKYHFSMPYPSSWSVVTSDDKSDSLFANDSNVTLHTVAFQSTMAVNQKVENRIEYFLYISNSTVDHMINVLKSSPTNIKDSVSFKTSTVKVAGISATQLTSTDGKLTSTDVYIPSGGRVYLFEALAGPSFSSGNVTDPIPAKMLQSFKITN